jgi:hypothetical protein
MVTEPVAPVSVTIPETLWFVRGPDTVMEPRTLTGPREGTRPSALTVTDRPARAKLPFNAFSWGAIGFPVVAGASPVVGSDAGDTRRPPGVTELTSRGCITVGRAVRSTLGSNASTCQRTLDFLVIVFPRGMAWRRMPARRIGAIEAHGASLDR